MQKKNKKERSSGLDVLSFERTKHFYIPCYFAKEISLHELEFDFIEMGFCSNQLLHAPIRVRLRFDLVNSFFGKIWLIVFIHILVTTKRIKSETGNKKSNMNHQSYKLKPSKSNHKWGFIKLKDNHVETIIIVFFHKFRIVHIKQASLI